MEIWISVLEDGLKIWIHYKEDGIMRKKISMILVVAMMAMVPVGCGSDDTSVNTNMSTVNAEQTEEQTEEQELARP